MRDSNAMNVKQQHPLLSHSSILIFSGFLIGLASAHSLAHRMSRIVLLAGIAGLIAYFALGLVAQKRQQRSTKAALRKATSHLEQQLERHNPRTLPALARRSRPHLSEEEEQYLTVVSTSRIQR